MFRLTYKTTIIRQCEKKGKFVRVCKTLSSFSIVCVAISAGVTQNMRMVYDEPQNVGE
jgi:hypothetical protein